MKKWIFKVVSALEDSNLLLKGFTKTIKNDTKEAKRGFLGMLWGILGGNLLGNMLTGQGILGAGNENKKRKRNIKSWLWK